MALDKKNVIHELIDSLKSIDISKLGNEATEKIKQIINEAKDLSTLDDLKVKLTGRKGIFKILFSKLPTLSPNLRKEAGAKLNTFKEMVIELIEQRRKEIMENLAKEKTKLEKIDVTLP